MADFCKQCSEELFGEDFGDLAGLVPNEPRYMAVALCEGCGFNCMVDHSGACVSADCLKAHGKEHIESDGQ